MITVLFSCEACGLVDVEVRVRARQREEDVKRYIEQTIAREIHFTHQIKSRFQCQAQRMTNMKIPIDNNDPDFWIGKQTDIVPPKSK